MCSELGLDGKGALDGSEGPSGVRGQSPDFWLCAWMSSSLLLSPSHSDNVAMSCLMRHNCSSLFFLFLKGWEWEWKLMLSIQYRFISSVLAEVEDGYPGSLLFRHTYSGPWMLSELHGAISSHCLYFFHCITRSWKAILSEIDVPCRNCCACPGDTERMNGKDNCVSDTDRRRDMHLFMKMSYRIWKKFGDYWTIMNLLSEIYWKQLFTEDIYCSPLELRVKQSWLFPAQN